MKPAILLALTLAGCSPAVQTKIDTALASPPGALFCRVQLAGGGAIVTTLTAAAIGAAVPGSGPLVVIATGAAKQAVDEDCTKAAAATVGGVSGTPVVPQAVTAPPVAIVAPASPVVPTKP